MFNNVASSDDRAGLYFCLLLGSVILLSGAGATISNGYDHYLRTQRATACYNSIAVQKDADKLAAAQLCQSIESRGQ